MKTKDAYNGSRRRGERFLRLWSEVAQGVFPCITEKVGELDSEHRLFVSVCEAVIDPKGASMGSDPMDVANHDIMVRAVILRRGTRWGLL